MNTVVTYLKELNLTEAEAKLYLTLLKTGPVSVRDLAAVTDIKRTTAYLYIEQLLEKGLITKQVKGSQKLIEANPPESLAHLITKERESAEIAKKHFDEVVTLIKSRMPEAEEKEEVEVRYYKGVNGIMKVYAEALEGVNFRLYVNLSELDKLLNKDANSLPFDLFEKAIVKNKELHIYEILADVPGSVDQYDLEGTQHKGRYYYKYMPHTVGLTAPGILLFDNKVAIISGKDIPHVYVLYNQVYYENSKRLFDFIWDVLPGFKKEELA